MLLSFKTSNFKSFVDEIELKMTPAPKMTSMSYSIIKVKIGPEKIKGLSSSVIYGPNASGKTNIISAMDTFKNIILRGNIKNSPKNYTPDFAAWNLELVPNFNLPKIEPTTFSIEFINDKYFFNYMISIELGKFLDKNYGRKINKEKLYVNNEMLFERTYEKLVINEKALRQYVNSSSFSYSNAFEVSSANIDKEELFICNGFKNVYSKSLYDVFYDWFAEKLDTVYSSNSLNTSFVGLSNDEKNRMQKIYNDVAKEIGISSLRIDLVEEDGNYTMVSVFPKTKNDKKYTGVRSEIVESYGTVRFLNLIPILKKAIDIGGTVIFDEMDSSINPMVITSLLNVFHNQEINKQGAQLIFNTHNPIFLNKNLLRRDEIKFVEKNDITGASEVYSLSDFGTSGKNGVRNTSDYMKNYYINRYGAIKYIDISKIFKESEK